MKIEIVRGEFQQQCNGFQIYGELMLKVGDIHGYESLVFTNTKEIPEDDFFKYAWNEIFKGAYENLMEAIKKNITTK